MSGGLTAYLAMLIASDDAFYDLAVSAHYSCASCVRIVDLTIGVPQLFVILH